MARLSLGGNVVVEEDENGDAVITNTADGTSISLESFISIVGGGLGDAANPVPGTSYFETADADSVVAEELNGGKWVRGGESIVAALDEVGQGGEVHVAEGEYDENIEFRADDQRLTAHGEVIINPSSGRAFEQGNTTDVQNCTASGLTLISDDNEPLRVRVGSSGLNFAACTLSGNNGSFIPSTECTLSRCCLGSPTVDEWTIRLEGDRNALVNACRIFAPSSADTVTVVGNDNAVLGNFVQGTLSNTGTNNETTPNVIY